MAVELATAYVSLIPSFKGGASKLSEELGGPAEKAADDAGEKSGKKFSVKFGNALKVGMVAAAALITKAVGGAMELQDGRAKLTASLGLTAKESERLGGIAGHLFAQNYGDSLEDVNTAIESVVSSIKGMRNASGADVEAMTGKVLNFAKVFEVDTARAAQIVGQLINSGIAKDGTQAMDLLTASMQRVPAAVREDIVDAVDEYGPFLKSIGITGERAFGLLVNGAQKGMYGIDKTGDALKEFTIRATDMSTGTQAAYKTLGLNAKNTTNDLLAGGQRASGAFDKVVTGLLNIKDPATRANTALALFGTPLEDLGVNEIPKFLKGLTKANTGLGNTAGAADKMGQTLGGTASSNLTSFGRQAQMAFVNIVGGKVLPIVTTVARFLAATFGPALKFVGDVITNQVIPAAKSMWDFMVKFREILIPVGIAIAAVVIGLKAYQLAMTLVSLVTKGWAIAQAALNVVMSANPIGLIIIAITALVASIVYVWNHVAGFRDFWITVWNAIKTAFFAVINAVKTAFNAAINFLISIFKNYIGIYVAAWNVLKGAALAVINAVKNAFRTSVEAIKTAFKTVVGWLGDRWQDIKNVFSGVLTFFTDIGTKMGNGIKDGFKAAVNGLIDLINNTVIWGANKLIDGMNVLPGVSISHIPPIPKLATGGIVAQGGLVTVGERGREVVSLPEGAQVYNNRQSEAFLSGGGGGGGMTIEHLEIKAYSDRFSLKQVQDELAMMGSV
jgi:phage-related minor tail protein